MYPELTRDEVFMIGTERLWLRWPRRTDAEALARIGGHPDVAAMTATWPVGCAADYAHERIEKMRARTATGEALSLVIAQRAAWDTPIGLIGIAVADDAATLGYHLDPDHWGQGFASEAVTGLIGMTRLLTRIDRVEAAVMPHNTASLRVLEKTGFVRTGLGTFDSPIRGPLAVVRHERRLRQRSTRQPAGARRSTAQPAERACA